MDRTEIQEEALQAWKRAGNWGTVILSTGVGKTRLGVMAHRSLEGVPKTLVITSRVPIVHQWMVEFEGVENVEFLCIQSAYKYVGDYDLVIIDEVHRALSPEYRKVFESVTTKSLICLTATLPQDEEYVEFLGQVSPVIYAKHLAEVVEAGVLPRFQIYNLEVPLARESKGKYRLFDNSFKQAAIDLSRIRSKNPSLINKYSSSFVMAKHESLAKEDSIVRRAAKQYWGSMTMRKQVVYSNPAKIIAAKAIINKVGADRKWILFNKSIAFAEKLQAEVGGELYHSKMHKNARIDVLERFKRSEFNILVVVDALTEGVNIEVADAAICLSGVSTKLDNVQKIGRLLRTREGKKQPIYINLYTENTVEKGWVESKTDKAGLKQYTKWISNLTQILTPD